MIRKTIFAVATVAAVTAATLAPASAKGGGKHHNHRHWHGSAVFITAPLVVTCWKYYRGVKIWVCD